jgi:hypothetical protein
VGIITVKTSGSLPNLSLTVTAQEGGHAFALYRAIDVLLNMMPDAIAMDHRLQDEGERPPISDFGKLPEGSKK